MSQPKLNPINIASGQFTANGRKYYIQTELSVRRYVAYLQESTEITFGVTPAEMIKKLTEAYNAVTDGNNLLAGVHKNAEILMNLLNAVVDFTNTPEPKILRFCALFINREGENVKEWDKRVVDSKVEDWALEGIPVSDFFVLAPSFIEHFKEHLTTQLGVNLPESEGADETSSPSKNTASNTTTTSTPPSPDSSEPDVPSSPSE